MNFGEATAQAFAGAKIRRAGWNGPDQWVCWMPPTVVPANEINERTRRHIPVADAGEAVNLSVGGYFVIWTQQKIWQPGWLASQADMAATDWELANGA